MFGIGLKKSLKKTLAVFMVGNLNGCGVSLTTCVHGLQPSVQAKGKNTKSPLSSQGRVGGGLLRGATAAAALAGLTLQGCAPPRQRDPNEVYGYNDNDYYGLTPVCSQYNEDLEPCWKPCTQDTNPGQSWCYHIPNGEGSDDNFTERRQAEDLIWVNFRKRIGGKPILVTDLNSTKKVNLLLDDIYYPPITRDYNMGYVQDVMELGPENNSLKDYFNSSDASEVVRLMKASNETNLVFKPLRRCGPSPTLMGGGTNRFVPKAILVGICPKGFLCSEDHTCKLPEDDTDSGYYYPIYSNAARRSDGTPLYDKESLENSTASSMRCGANYGTCFFGHYCNGEGICVSKKDKNTQPEYSNGGELVPKELLPLGYNDTGANSTHGDTDKGKRLLQGESQEDFKLKSDYWERSYDDLKEELERSFKRLRGGHFMKKDQE